LRALAINDPEFERSRGLARQALTEQPAWFEHLAAFAALQALSARQARDPMDVVEDEAQRALLAETLLAETRPPEENEVQSAIQEIHERAIERRQRELRTLIAEAEKNRPDVSMDQIAMQIAEDSLRTIKNSLLPQLNLYGLYAGSAIGGPLNPECSLGTQCTTTLPSGFSTILQNTFNYTAPEYRVGMNLNITLRNRIAKADQFRAVLEFRQNQLTFEEQKKNIRLDVRNSQYALQQARARVDAAIKARDLAQKTFDITKQEQQLGAKSSFDTLLADHDLAVQESALVVAQNAYDKAKVSIDQSVGETLERMGISIDDAKSGVVSHMQQ